MNLVGTRKNDRLTGGADNDSLAGGDGADILHGLGGHDLIQGQDGADQLFGDAGNDYLIGGKGNDLLDGGDGFDWADYADAVCGVRINLSRTQAQNTLGAGVDRLVSIEQVYGSVFADELRGSNGDNQLVGAGGADTLLGRQGRDTLIGGDGDDVIDGGSGRDYYEGGKGDDLFYVQDSDDYAHELAGEGVDTVISSATFSICVNVENLTLTGDADIDGWGNVGDNRMVGNAGDNTLYGYEGDDVLFGGAGDDVLGGGDDDDLIDGGQGSDTLTFAGSAIAVTVDLRATGAQDTGRGMDRLISIENVFGSRVDDVFIGNAVANRFEGDVGKDTYRFFTTADLDGDTVVKAAGVGDRIDVSGIDADSGKKGDQHFKLVDAFTGHAGEAVYDVEHGCMAATLSLDVDGDGQADATLDVVGADVDLMGFVL